MKKILEELKSFREEVMAELATINEKLDAFEGEEGEEGEGLEDDLDSEDEGLEDDLDSEEGYEDEDDEALDLDDLDADEEPEPEEEDDLAQIFGLIENHEPFKAKIRLTAPVKMGRGTVGKKGQVFFIRSKGEDDHWIGDAPKKIDRELKGRVLTAYLNKAEVLQLLS